MATVAAVFAFGLAGCGGSSRTAGPVSTLTAAPTTGTAARGLTVPTTAKRASPTSAAPTTADLAQTKAELDGTTGLLNGANTAIGASDPNAAKSQEGTAP
jgi:hypothetical protein